jgi:HEAT repeat protein
VGRAAGPEALWRDKPADAVIGLIKQLSDKDAVTRAQVAAALAQFAADSQAAIVPLTKALEDDNPLVRASTAMALARIRRAKSDEANRNLNLAMHDPRVQDSLHDFMALYFLAALAHVQDLWCRQGVKAGV